MLPTRHDPCSLVVLEALASGLPVVASDLDVLRAFLAHEESALLVPCGDGAALGSALLRAATDAALADRLRAGGRAVVARHSWDAAARAHEDAYRAFLAAGAPVRG